MARRDPDAYGPPDKLLLVEGEDDKHLFWNLLETHRITAGVRIKDAGGYENLRSQLGPTLRAGNQKRLGLVVDADADPENRWRSLRDVLERVGYTLVPEAPLPQGTIIRHQDADENDEAEPPYKTTVGIWLMPDNSGPGMMEDFGRLLMAPDDPLWHRAAEAVAGIPDGERRFTVGDIAKANLHTWLAWMAKPGQPIGRAIKMGYLRHDAPPAQLLVGWVRALFDL